MRKGILVSVIASMRSCDEIININFEPIGK